MIPLLKETCQIQQSFAIIQSQIGKEDILMNSLLELWKCCYSAPKILLLLNCICFKSKLWCPRNRFVDGYDFIQAKQSLNQLNCIHFIGMISEQET